MPRLNSGRRRVLNLRGTRVLGLLIKFIIIELQCQHVAYNLPRCLTRRRLAIHTLNRYSSTTITGRLTTELTTCTDCTVGPPLVTP
jgi:hypothetical protein